MPNYVDAETQTVLSGLTRGDFVRPEFLFSAPETSTPPDEILTEKGQPASLSTGDSAQQLSDPPQQQSSQLPLQPKEPSTSSLLERRQNRPKLPARISLPLDDEVPRSPPPTQAVLSPLPVANRLHAGHTPLLPLSPVLDELEVMAQAAPVEEEEDQTATPQQDEALHGPLILPTNPVDGAAENNITLDELDDALSRLAAEQERFSRLKDAPEPSSSSQAAPMAEPGSPSLGDVMSELVVEPEPSDPVEQSTSSDTVEQSASSDPVDQSTASATDTLASPTSQPPPMTLPAPIHPPPIAQQAPIHNPVQATQNAPAPAPGFGLSLSRQGSTDSQRSENQNVDGVILKSPPLNFGKPLGET